MALITNTNITAQLAQLANTGTIDTSTLLGIINQGLSPDEQLINAKDMIRSIGVYKRFSDYDMIKAKPEIVTTGLWSGDTGQISKFYSSSLTLSSSKYYVNVYSSTASANPSNPSNPVPEVEFAIAYGHAFGSGSANANVNENTTYPTKATYFQYRSMLLNPGDTRFSFQNSSGIATNSDSIYVINLSRNRFRQSIDPGNWQLTLSGSAGIRTFIDNSGKTLNDANGLSGRVFQIASGAIDYSTGTATINSLYASNGLGFGLFYPDRGILVFNPTALGASLGSVTFSTGSGHTEIGNVSGSITTAYDTYNHMRLFAAISGGGDFDCRRTETISTQHFFVRVTNKEFNYSNNPSFVTTSSTFAVPQFETDPYTYITTLGLYNDANELVAVAKTSQPIPKSFDREALIKVKLSY